LSGQRHIENGSGVDGLRDLQAGERVKKLIFSSHPGENRGPVSLQTIEIPGFQLWPE